MKIKVYVHFFERNVITEKEYKERFNKALDEAIADDADFRDWLNRRSTATQMWNITPEGRERVWKEWKECCRDYVEYGSDLAWWHEFELEV